MNKQYESYLAGSLKSVLESIEEARKMPSEITNLYKAANESLSNSEYHCLENKKKCLEELNNAQSYLKKLVSKVSSLSEENNLRESNSFGMLGIKKTQEFGEKFDTENLAKKFNIGKYLGYFFDIKNKQVNLIGEKSIAVLDYNLSLRKEILVHK